MTPIRFLLTALPFATLPLTAAPTAAAAPPVATEAAPPLAPRQAATWPLQPRPRVVRGFDLPAKPWLPGHRGVDLSGSPGQPVLAATSGTITYAGQLAGRGVIVLSTGPRRTTYEPVVPAVAVGAVVTPGTVIGRLSAAGSHCAPATCLHWGLVQGKQYLNPLTLLPDRPVRLLPLTQTQPRPPTPKPALSPTNLQAEQEQDPGAPSAYRPQRGADTPGVDASGSGPPRPPTLANASAPRGQRTATAVVATTAALTLAAGLMIRRH